jgi:hypothetical protein
LLTIFGLQQVTEDKTRVSRVIRVFGRKKLFVQLARANMLTG